MSYCINCVNKDAKTGACNNPNCVFKLYNIDPEYVPDIMKVAKTIIDEEVKKSKIETKSEDEVVFNPFQRGNGCTLAGYTAKEILSHTR